MSLFRTPQIVLFTRAVILWTDDAPAGYARLVELGAKPIKTPEPWLDRLLIAWVEDLDGHLMQVVQAVS